MTLGRSRLFASRVLGVAGGLTAGFGIVSLTVTAAEWLTPRGTLGPAFILVGLIAMAAALAMRRRLTSPTLRLAVLLAAGSALAMLTLIGAMSGYIRSKTDAYVTAMRSDLRSLDAAQEALKRETGTYSDSTPPGFRSSVGVSPPLIAITSDGWTASVGHAATARTCAMFVGRTPIPPAVEERRPACTSAPFRAGDHLAGMAFVAIGLILTGLARALDPREPTADAPRPDTA
jgi:hypothetical protein